MIYNFPDPYPDEILYSLCARYSDRMQYLTPGALTIELFGRITTAKVGLPNCLNYLVAHLPPKSTYTVTSLIDNHTLFPFYRQFLPTSVSQILKGYMEAGERKPVHVITGIRDWSWPSSCTKLCPLCVKEDQKQFGECYWHRVHQIPCVDVCPDHNICLYNAYDYIDEKFSKNSYDFLSAEKLLYCIPASDLKLVENEPKIFLDISRDASYLLQNHTTDDSISLKKRCLFLLAEKGKASYNGRVHISKIQQEFQRYYGISILKHFRCELTTVTHSNWLAKLLYNNTTRVFSPIRQILFIHFMGYNIENFLKLPKGDSPFGSGPWPCLNPVCKNYKERCITHCEVVYTGNLSGRPRGRFSCHCGFVYSRVGPDHSEEDLFKMSPVRIYGPLWEAKLKEIWSNPLISVREAARILGTDAGVIHKQAKRLGLSNSHIQMNIPPSQITRDEGPIHAVHVVGPDLLKRYRSNWLLAMEKYPNSGMKQLIRKFSKEYQWLCRHDAEWLKIHSPTFEQRSIPPRPQVDWAQRDRQFAAEIHSFALTLKHSHGRPLLMCTKLLLSNVRQKELVQRNLHKLPVTAKTLDEFTETKEEFALRRIHWAAESFRQENLLPSKTSLIKRAGVEHAQKRWSSIEKAINDELQTNTQ